MMKQKQTRVLIQVVLIAVIILAILATVGASSAAAIPAPTSTPAAPERPLPPYIETWGIPDPQGGEPAGCVGQPGCGVMCYYISENATENHYELSCIPWIFE